MATDHPWPRRPWFRWLGLLLSVGGLVWFVQIQKRRMPLVEREDLTAFIRVTLPAVPGLKTYTVLETAKGDLAVSGDSGTLYRTSIKPDRQKLKLFLESEVYGQPLWRVLEWPLLAFLVVLIALVKLGRLLDERNNGERLLQGAPILSHWHWNWPLLFNRSERGFYIETE